jgi:hypothetical protein
MGSWASDPEMSRAWAFSAVRLGGAVLVGERRQPEFPFVRSGALAPHRFVEMGIPKQALKRYIPKHAVIVEAGAHHGIDTVQFARLSPSPGRGVRADAHDPR